MSNVIEQKILEMRFDNKQFEDNVSESISTLDKLKGALNFDKVSGAFGAITQAAARVDLSPVTNSVDAVVVKFNAMEMAVVQAVSNIINNGIFRLKSAVDSVTFDQITAGWGKYEEKTQSVQTIMSATGKTIDEVSEQLQRLNWFSDETSYSFTDMTSNVGKFTSVGVELEDAVSAMEGISTWAALSGANVGEAARAMYNLSQAMGVGAVKLMDWRSIENAGMATSEFKKTVMEAAVSVGTLTKSTDGLYKTLKGTEVTVNNFNSTLADGWFDTKVLMGSLEVYGGFANELSKACETLDTETFKVLDAIEAYNGTQESLSDLMEETGLSAEELTPIIEKLSGKEYELGRKAFVAAQSAKTFSDAVNATKDAVSTGWMNTFEYLFGNFERARDFFSEVTEYFYNLFATSGNVRNEILKSWAKLGGDKVFRDSLLNILESTQNVVDYIRKVIFQITGVWDENGKLQQSFIVKLVDFTKRFAGWTDQLVEFTSKIELTDKAIVGLKNIFNGISSGLGIILDAVSALRPAFEWLVGILLKISTYLMENVFDNIGKGLTQLREYIDRYDLFEKAVERVGKAGKKAWEMIKVALQPISDLLTPIIEKLQSVFSIHSRSDYWKLFDNIREKLTGIFNIDVDDKKIWRIVINVRNALYDIIEFLTNIFGQVKDFVNKSGLEDFFAKIWGIIKNIGSGLLNFLGNFKLSKFFKEILNGISSVSESVFSFLGKINLSDILDKVTTFGEKVVSVFRNMFSGIKTAFQNFNLQSVLETFGNGIGNIFETLKNTDISSVLSNLLKGTMIFGGFNLGNLLGSGAKGLNAITDTLTKEGVGGFFKGLTTPIKDFFGNLKDSLGSFTDKTDDTKLMEIAKAIGILTVALIFLSGIDSEKIGTGLAGLAGVLTGIAGELFAMSKMDLSGGKQFKNVGTAMVEVAAAAWIIVQAVKPFAEMETGQIVKALGAMSIILVEFAAFTFAFSKIAQANQIGNTDKKGFLGIFQKSNGWDKQMKNVAKAMIELGVAMKLFASAAEDFSDVKRLKESIQAMTIVMTEMMGFIAVASLAGKYGDLKSITKTTFGMVELGVAMKLFAQSMDIIGSIETSDRIQMAINGSVVAMTEMISFAAVAGLFASKSSGISKIGFAMVELGAAMKLFAQAMGIIATIDTADKVQLAINGSVAAMTEMLAFVAVAGIFAGKSGQIAVIAGSMVVLGLAMKEFAEAMTVFGKEEQPNLWIANLAKMSAVFTEMLVFIGVASLASSMALQIFAISASMVALGLAMQTFAKAMHDFEGVQPEQFGQFALALTALVAALTALAVVGTVGGAGLIAVGTALLMIGGAIALIGVGVTALNLGSIVNDVHKLTGGIGSIGTGLKMAFNQMGGIKDRIVQIGTNIGKASNQIPGLVKNLKTNLGLDNFLKIIEAIPKALSTVIPDIITGLVTGIIKTITEIAKSLTSVFDAAETIILSFLEFASSIAPKIVDTFLSIILDVLTSITENAPEILTTVFDLIIKILDGLIEYLPQITEKFAVLFIKLFDNLTNYIPEMLQSFMKFLGAVFGEIMNVIQSTDQDTLVKIAEMFLGLVGVITVLNLIKSMIPGAMLGLAEISLFIAELTLIIAAFGALNSIPGFQWLVEKGGDLLEAVGVAIGKFVGGIIGGFAEGATSTLPQVGKNISDFWTNIKPFIDGVSQIDMETVAKVGVLTASIIALTYADFLGGIADFMRDALNIQEFGVSITKMWKNIQPFIEGVRGLDPETVSSVETLAKAILILTAGELIDAITSFIFGGKDIDNFGTSISKLGPYLKTFSDSVKDIDTLAVKTASDAIGILAEAFDRDIFKTGGLKQAIFGENSDLVKFGEGLVALGPNIKAYAETVRGLDVDVIDNSIRGANALAEMAAKLPKKGGVVGQLKGNSDLVDFAAGLAALGPKLMSYAKSVKGLDVSIVKNSINAAKAISEFATNLEDVTIFDKFLKKDKMEEFGNSLNILGTSLKDYYANIANINVTQVLSLVTATKKLFELISGASGITFKIDKGFKTAMQELANSGISEFVSSFATSVTEVKDSGLEFMESFADGLGLSSESLKETFEEMFSYCMEKFEESYNEFRKSGRTLMENFALGITDTLRIVKAAVNTILTAITDLVTSDKLLAAFRSAGSDIMVKFMFGILSEIISVATAAEAVGLAVLREFTKEEYLKAIQTAGSGIMEEFIRGMNSQAALVQQAARKIASDARTSIEGELAALHASVQSYIDDNFNFQPVITPVYDDSELQRQTNDIRQQLEVYAAQQYLDNNASRNAAYDAYQNGGSYYNGGNYNTNNTTVYNPTFNINGATDPKDVASTVNRSLGDLFRQNMYAYSRWG